MHKTFLLSAFQFSLFIHLNILQTKSNFLVGWHATKNEGHLSLINCRWVCLKSSMQRALNSLGYHQCFEMRWKMCKINFSAAGCKHEVKTRKCGVIMKMRCYSIERIIPMFCFHFELMSSCRSALTLTLSPNASFITHPEDGLYTLLQGVHAQTGQMILDDLGGKMSHTALECFLL